jgi:hypothetical protein
MKYISILKYTLILFLLTPTHIYAATDIKSDSTTPNTTNHTEYAKIKKDNYYEFFINSLQDGASNESANFDYFLENKCEDRTINCYLLLSALGNLLLDHGDLKNGLKSAIYGYELIHDSDYCPIAHEIVVINYKIKKIRSLPDSKASDQARSILKKINDSGGFSNNLKTSSCEVLKTESPLYFDKYNQLIGTLIESIN